jgi:O-antigen biosynthesis protein
MNLGDLIRTPSTEAYENVDVRIHDFNPLQYPISTRIPARYDVGTAWIGHVPFAMSLVDMIRPRLLVELGPHLSVSYCAFCEAVKELRLAECCAIGVWRKDPYAAFGAEAEEALESLKTHHDERYSRFSKFMNSTFDDAAEQFNERTIDLLHIDGCSSYNAVKHDFETWLPKISDGGVVLLHNIDVNRDSSGSGQFWGEVKQKYRHFEFFHSYGLGVLVVGECIPTRLRALIDLSPNHHVLVRRYFANLGTYLTALQVIDIQRTNLYELLDAKIEECERLEAGPAAMEIELAALRRRCGRLRYRIVDRAAQVLGKIPLLPGIMWFTVDATIRLVRKRSGAD